MTLRPIAALCPARVLTLSLLLVVLPPRAQAGGDPLLPLAVLPSAAPWSDVYESRQHRVREAESKARAGLRRQQTEKQRDPASAKAMNDFDVKFYSLVINLNPVTRILTGTTTVQALVVAPSLTQVHLDLGAQMAVSGTRAAGVAVARTHLAGVLTVNLDRTYTSGEMVSVEVDYAGNPAGSYFGWSTYGGQPLIWTLSEPYGARVWWPCKDLNTDKADSVALYVTVPDNLVVASNGVLESVTVPAAGKKTYHWRERYPICTYLVSLAVHPYATITDTYYSAGGDTMPVVHYVVPGEVANATIGFAPTVDMIAAFAGAFGEYPFVKEKYGHAQFPWGGGMEHQTCTSLYYGTYAEYIIAHELGHQWFGDLITCADFRHIWLNEGFATWMEAYWKEVRYGIEYYHAEMASARYTAGGTIYVANPSDFNAIFSYWLSYAKASWVPHMLRHVVGDPAFFAGLQQYRVEHGYGSATTEQFQAIMETASGRNLGPFFQQWIYGQYVPSYQYSWVSDPTDGGWRVRMRIAQTQTNTGLFEMPLDVQIETLGATARFTVENSLAEQWYTFDVAQQPIAVQLDPDNWVLCEKSDAGVASVPVATAAAPMLKGAAPNPFNPRTEIRFSLPEASGFTLDIFDAAGRLIKTLEHGRREAGEHSIVWDGADRYGRASSSGTYFARLRVGADTSTASLTLVR